MSKPCLICSLPIEGGELLLNRDWHSACEKCHYCQESMQGGHDQIKKCLADKIPVSHSFCFEQACLSDLRKKACVEAQHISILNDLMTRKNWEPAAGQETQDQLHSMLVKMQECCANISYVLSCVRDKVGVQKAETYRQESKEKREKEKREKIESETEKLEKQARSEMFANERKNPTLRAARKSIQSLLDIGWKFDMALEWTCKQMQLDLTEMKKQLAGSDLPIQ